MKKSIICILAILALPSALTGCKKENPDAPVQGDVELVFDAQVGLQTKYSGGDSFEEDDVISLYATRGGVALLQTGNYIDNAKYVRGEEFFAKEGNSDYFPAAGSIEIYAFYPYDANGIVTTTTEYLFSCQADQSTSENLTKSDFLLAKQTVAPSLQPVTLSFGHSMSKLIVRAVTGNDYKDGTQVESVTLLSAKRHANVNISSNTTIATSTGAEDIIPNLSTDAENPNVCVAQAIVAPQTIAKNTLFGKVKLTNGKEYDLALSDKEVILYQGKHTVIDIVVSFGGDKALLVAASIIDWNKVDLAKDINVIEGLKNAFNGTYTEPVMPNFDKAYIVAQIAGESKTSTYEVDVKSNTTNKTVYFEFRGTNNLPSKFPYNITKIGFKSGLDPIVYLPVTNGNAVAENDIKSFDFSSSSVTFK